MKRLLLVLTLLVALSLACARAGSVPTPAPTMTAAIAAAATSLPRLIPATRVLLTSLPPDAPSPVATSTPNVEPSPMIEVPVQAAPNTSLADITYCTVNNVALKMDVYFPTDLSQARPAAVYVHGGGWYTGDKRSAANLEELPGLLASNFVVFSINYRLAPEYHFPTMIEDVKCAIRSIRAHADEYHIDPNRIGAWGGSAGGHLVSLLGTSDESAGFDVGEYLDYSSRVQAVVDLFGPTDLTVHFNSQQEQIGRSVFSDDQLVMASPVTYVSQDDPPFLIQQGDKDQLVPLEQSQILYDRLTAAGVPATLVIVRNGGHGFNPIGGPIDPNRADLTQMIVDFFVENLK